MWHAQCTEDSQLTCAIYWSLMWQGQPTEEPPSCFLQCSCFWCLGLERLEILTSFLLESMLARGKQWKVPVLMFIFNCMCTYVSKFARVSASTSWSRRCWVPSLQSWSYKGGCEPPDMDGGKQNSRRAVSALTTEPSLQSLEWSWPEAKQDTDCGSQHAPLL